MQELASNTPSDWPNSVLINKVSVTILGLGGQETKEQSLPKDVNILRLW